MIVLKLGVYRRLDNRLEGLSDSSPRAVELHNRRKKALHEVFDDDKSVVVKNWGKTDDTTRTHEVVEIVVGIASAAFSYAIAPGLKSLGKKLAEKLVDRTTSECAKYILSKLIPKQKKKEILDFSIELPDGTKISCDPPERGSIITIYFNDGKIDEIRYG